MEQGLDLAHKQVSLRKERSNLEFISLCSFPQNPTGEIDRRQRKRSEQRGANVHAPAPGLHLDDAADN